MRSSKSIIYKSKDIKGTNSPFGRKPSKWTADFIEADEKAGTGLLNTKSEKRKILAKVNEFVDKKGSVTVKDAEELLADLKFGKDLSIRKRREIDKFAKEFLGIDKVKKKHYYDLLSNFKEKGKDNKNESNIAGQKFSVGKYSKSAYKGSAACRETSDIIASAMKRGREAGNDSSLNGSNSNDMNLNNNKPSSSSPRINLVS